MKVHFKENSIQLELEVNSGVIGCEDKLEKAFIEQVLGLEKGKTLSVEGIYNSFGNLYAMEILKNETKS